APLAAALRLRSPAATAVPRAQGTGSPAEPTPDVEDRRAWSADRKAVEATRRLTDLREQAHQRRQAPCPAVGDWHGWFEETLTLEACWVAMREIRDQVRKSGAGRDSVHDFRQTFGSFEEWEVLRDALRQKMSDCADELKIARRTRAEEIRLVREREEQGVALELGESGFGPRVTAPALRREPGIFTNAWSARTGRGSPNPPQRSAPRPHPPRFHVRPPRGSARDAAPEPRGEEGIDKSGGADHRPIHAGGKRLAGALDRGDAAHREDGPVPGACLSPREQLLHLHTAVVPHRLAGNARELSARPSEGGRAVGLDHAPQQPVDEHEAVDPPRDSGGH